MAVRFWSYNVVMAPYSLSDLIKFTVNLQGHSEQTRECMESIKHTVTLKPIYIMFVHPK